MSDRDLIQELKTTIKDLSDEKDDLLKTIKQKESRIKTVMIKLEHATSDVSSIGHKIEDQNKEIVMNALSLKRQIDVWGDQPGGMDIMRRIKQMFDPLGILSPGRFVGRL